MIGSILHAQDFQKLATFEFKAKTDYNRYEGEIPKCARFVLETKLAKRKNRCQIRRLMDDWNG